MKKRQTGWTLAALTLVVSATAAWACEGHPPAADANNPKDAKDPKAVVASTPTAGCDMPCCAHAKEAADTKVVADTKVLPDGKALAAVKTETPCAGGGAKGCPKKAAATTAVAKAQPTKEAPTAEPAPQPSPAEPAADPGTRR